MNDWPRGYNHAGDRCCVLPSSLFDRAHEASISFLPFPPSLSLRQTSSLRPPSNYLIEGIEGIELGGVVSTVEGLLRLTRCSEPEIGAGGGTRWCAESSKSASLPVAAAAAPRVFSGRVLGVSAHSSSRKVRGD